MKYVDLAETEDFDDIPFKGREDELFYLKNKRVRALARQQAYLNGFKENYVRANRLIPTFASSTVKTPNKVKREAAGATFFVDLNDHEVNKWIDAVNLVSEKYRKAKDRQKALTITGHKFVFTGFRDKNMEDHIVKLRGSVVSAVSKQVDFVIAVDPNETTGKIEKAREFGIPVISRDEFAAILYN